MSEWQQEPIKSNESSSAQPDIFQLYTAILNEHQNDENFGVLDGYLLLLEKVTGVTPKVQEFELTDEKGSISRGKKIMFSEPSDPSKIKYVLSLDVDDTVIDYSGKKPNFQEAISEILKEKEGLHSNTFEASKLFNSVGRVVSGDIRPEGYCPILEIIAIDKLSRDQASEQAQLLLNNPTKENAQLYMQSIFPEIELKPRDDGKLRFYEKDNEYQVDLLGPCPEDIDPKIWQAYQQEMITTQLTSEEAELLQMPKGEEVYTTLFTFGRIEFQLAKILSLFQNSPDIPLPNEIIIVEQGRKKLALLEFSDRFPEAIISHADDSMRQLEDLDGHKRFHLFAAWRKGAKRETEVLEQKLFPIIMAGKQPWKDVFDIWPTPGKKGQAS